MSEPGAKPRTMVDLDEFERRLSRPPSASRTNGDPLAELARLVGGQQDPFGTVFEELAPSQPLGGLRRRRPGIRSNGAFRNQPRLRRSLIRARSACR